MDYERIDKPSQTSGFSPSKLRSMLLGVEKRRKEEEQQEPRFSLRSDAAEIDDGRGSGSDGCKDVDVVTSPPPLECSTSTDMPSGGHRLRDHTLAVSRFRSQEEDCFDSESVFSLAFEFHKPERAVHRPALVPPFSKPPPSKWDDAEKWIASPTSNRQGKAGGAQPKKSGLIGGHRNRNPATKVVLEVTDEVDAKRMDPSLAKREIGGQKAVSWLPDQYPVVDSDAKPALILENKITDSTVSLIQHDSSQSVHSATTIITPPSTVKSVSMRDMGTEMTPAASKEPSRTGTPLGATTPTRSPTNSRSSTPGRIAPRSTPIESADFHGNSNKKVLSEKELQMEVRREIVLLGTQLGKANIAAWASKEHEEAGASTSLKNVQVGQTAESIIETRAAAWEEAEKTKYLARFKQEEIKIQAWENHQKAKTEAEMRKVEVDVERMRARAHDRLMNKLATARHKAEEKRAAAETKRNQQAARTAEQAECIRKTGHIPSSFSCWSLCS